MSRRIASILLLPALVLAGCSLAMREPPTTLPARGAVDCSDGSLAPTLDGLDMSFGIYMIIASPAAAGLDESGHGERNFVALAAGGAAVTGLFLASMVHGIHVAHRCRDARAAVAANEQRLDEQLHEQLRARPMELLETAIRAARANDCATVLQLGATIEQLDPALHDRVFTSNPEIQKCRAAVPAGAATR